MRGKYNTVKKPEQVQRKLPLFPGGKYIYFRIKAKTKYVTVSICSTHHFPAVAAGSEVLAASAS